MLSLGLLSFLCYQPNSRTAILMFTSVFTCTENLSFSAIVGVSVIGNYNSGGASFECPAGSFITGMAFTYNSRITSMRIQCSTGDSRQYGRLVAGDSQTVFPDCPQGYDSFRVGSYSKDSEDTPITQVSASCGGVLAGNLATQDTGTPAPYAYTCPVGTVLVSVETAWLKNYFSINGRPDVLNALRFICTKVTGE